jgi:hypothetical protein
MFEARVVGLAVWGWVVDSRLIDGRCDVRYREMR